MNLHERYLRPDIVSGESTIDMGEIRAGRRVDQTFTCRVDHLCRVDCLMGTMNRANTSDFAVTLWEGAGASALPVRQGLFSAGEVQDNQWHPFTFDPIPGSLNRRYTLTFSSPNGKRGNAVTVWRDAEAPVSGETLRLSGVSFEGRLSFKTFGIKNEKIFQNCLDHLQDVRLKRTVPRALPLQFYLEVTTRCNLNCIICRPRVVEEMYEKKARGRGDFPFSAIGSMVPILETTLAANMFGWGEPFCHPDFLRFIRFIREHNPDCLVTFNTNGMMLDPARAGALLELDVSKICFSADSHRKEIFERIRKGADFETFKRHIAALVNQREKRGLPNPVVAMELVLLRQNIQDLPDFIRFADSLGVREVFLENLHGDYPDLAVEDYREGLAAYERAREAAAEKGMILSGPAVERFRALTAPGGGRAEQAAGGLPYCTEPWQTIYVEHSGNIIPCCYQQTEKELGNVLEENIIQIWRGEQYARLRKGVTEKPFYPGCEACIKSGKVPGSVMPPVTRQGFYMKAVTAETMIPPAEPSFLEQMRSRWKSGVKRGAGTAAGKDSP
jgi:MoaA/NifB/PqqE/SkfB family radical SAM enzyme